MKLSIIHPFQVPLLLLAVCCLTNRPNANAQKVSIPFGGNAFQISSKSTEEITDQGIENWESKNTVYALYFSLHTTQAVQLALPLIEQSDNSTLSISVNGAVKQYNLKAGDREIALGETALNGYNVIQVQGIRKSGSDFARIQELLIRHKEPIQVNYVPDNKDNNFYFGRRGPSVHLNYEFPENTDHQMVLQRTDGSGRR